MERSAVTAGPQPEDLPMPDKYRAEERQEAERDLCAGEAQAQLSH